MALRTFLLHTLLAARVTSSTDTCTNTVEGEYKHHSSCTQKHISGALMEGMECAPRPTLMALPWPNSTQFDQMTPTFISVNRCDGSCSQLRHSCLPTKTRLRRIPVLLSQCGISSGTCDKSCSSVSVEEHESCSCSCSLVPGDCAANQNYRSDLCTCECADILGREACLDSGQHWDEASCKCGCTHIKECTADQTFNQQTCSCVPLDANLDRQAEEERIPRSTDDFLTFEMIVILVLLSVIFVLMVIVFTLLMRIQTMKKNFRIEKMKLVQMSNETGEEGEARMYQTQVKKDGEVTLVENTKDVSVDRMGINCSTPSSGFYSEPEKQELDELYQSSEAVRQKKYSKVRIDQSASPRPIQRSAYGVPPSRDAYGVPPSREEELYSGGSIYSQLNSVRQYGTEYTPIVQNGCVSPVNNRREPY